MYITLTIDEIIEQAENEHLEAVADDIVCDRGEAYDDQNGCPCGCIAPAEHPLGLDPFDMP